MEVTAVAVQTWFRDQLLEGNWIGKQFLSFNKLVVQSVSKRLKALPERAPLRKECKGLPCGGFSLFDASNCPRHNVCQPSRIAFNQPLGGCHALVPEDFGDMH